MDHPFPGYSTNYSAYCLAHGADPETMDQRDGGSMVNFILWIGRMKPRFASAHPESMCGSNIADYDKWAQFLLQSALSNQ